MSAAGASIILASLKSIRGISFLRAFDLKASNGNKNALEGNSSVVRYFHATGQCCSKERDYYEILGVHRDASRDDIRKAFHALAKKYHPDANRNNPAAKRKFQEIRDAYEALRDPEKRRQYDTEFSQKSENSRYASGDARGFRYTYQGTENFEKVFNGWNRDSFSNTFYKIFSEVFESEGGGFAADIHVEINLSFAEAARGCTKTVSFVAQVHCDSCNGRGHPTNARLSKCATCNGTGRVTVFPFTTTCAFCKGLGHVIKDYCALCKGAGVVQGEKNVNVTIPAGVDSGDTINVPNAGNSGRRGTNPGNLYIKLQVASDPTFVREGPDIYVDCHISFTLAILGGKVEVPTLSGKTQVKIPKGVQHGQLLVLRGRGLPKNIGLVDNGDQYVRFKVQFPTSVNERQQEILEEFAKEEAIRESSEFTYENWWQQLVDQLNYRLDGPTVMLGISAILLIHLVVSKLLS